MRVRADDDAGSGGGEPVRQVELSTVVIGPNALAGSLSSRAVRPAKLTSPAKASVTVPAATAVRRCVPASPA